MEKANQIDVHIASDQDMNQTFVNTWKRAEKGQQREGQEHLYFEDAATLLKVLSNLRCNSICSLLYSDRDTSLSAH